MPTVTEQFINGPGTTLNGAITNVATSLIVTDATKFPLAPQFRALIESEIVLVTAVSGTTYTIARGQEGTAQAAHATGVAIVPILTADAQRRWSPDYLLQPRHNKLLAWTYPPELSLSSVAGTGGVLYLGRVYIPETITVANLLMYVGIAGATLTAAQNWAGFYDASGALIAKTADQTTAWASAGLKTMALTAEAGKSLTIVGGPDVAIWVAHLSNGTTKPAFRMANVVDTFWNIGLVAADKLRVGSSGTAQTTLPATVTMTALTSAPAGALFAALS